MEDLAEGLAAPGARVRAVLEEIFGPVTTIGAAFAGQRDRCAAAGAALTPDRLSTLRDVIWQQLGRLPAADGAGLVAAPWVVTGKQRHLEWWQRTGPAGGGSIAGGSAACGSAACGSAASSHDEDGGGFARIRLNLHPESVDLYDYLGMDWFTVPGRLGRR